MPSANQQKNEQSNKKLVDLNQKIRNVIPWVIANYESKSEDCRCIMNRIIEELDTDGKTEQDKNDNADSYAIIKLYINYYLCELIINYVKDEEVKNFLITVFPTPLKESSKKFLEQLLSLSICLNNKQILNALTFYIDNDHIRIIENEIKQFPDDLSKNCPLFVSTLINKGVFFNNTNSKLYTTSLLNSWLSGLNLNNDKQIKFDSQQLIKFILKNNEDCSSLLHYNLLEIIKKKLILNLNIKFFINLLNDNDLNFEKYSQVLIVALQNNCIDDLNDKTKKNLIKKLPANTFLISFLQTI